MNNKKILVVYPHNFLQGLHGTNMNIYQLLKIFKEINYDVDVFAYEGFTPDSNFSNFNEQNSEGLVNKLYLYDFGKSKKNSRLSIVRKIKNKIKFKNENHLQDWTNQEIQDFFDKVTYENKYDIVIITYSYLANLIIKTKNRVNYKKIYYMIDSMFLQQYLWDKKVNKKLTLGKLMDEELERLKNFDEFLCVSNDEKIFYEKLLEKKMYFIPHFSNNKRYALNLSNEKKWDIFFIGFNNPFNVEGLNWFLEEVYSYLDKNLKILLVGSATNNIKKSYSNVDIIQYVPDLEEVFENIKVSICPMFRGTGIKIKVVESMEKGIPVVCTERGVDGLPDKTECGCLVTEDPKEFAEYINKLVKDKDFYDETSEKIKKYYDKIFDREKYIKLIEKVLAQ